MAESEKPADKEEAALPIKSSGGELSPFEEMERVFDRFAKEFGSLPWVSPFHWPRPQWADLSAPFEGRVPKVDVIDRDTDILVRAELPGVNKENLDVSLTDTTLTIRAKTKQEKVEDVGSYHRREISSGEFARTVTLPAEVDGEKTSATFKNGVLELVLPKIAAAKRHNIKID